MRTLFLALVLVTLAPAKERHSKNVVLVMDVSCSMAGDLEEAYYAWQQISEQPTDDMHLGVVAFNDEAHLYSRWIRLPDAKKLEKAALWVRSFGAQGDTAVIPALSKALALPKKKLTVVLVSDGQFHSESTDRITKAIKVMQAEREKKGYGKALIACVGVGGASRKTLKAIQNGGGAFEVK